MSEGYQPFRNLTKNMLCAGYAAGGKSGCYGDSGGPLVCKDGDHWFQYGITSFGLYKTGKEKPKQCDREKHPSVFANVVSLLSWIQANTGSQYLCMHVQCSLVDFLAEAEYPDPPQISTPPKIRRKKCGRRKRRRISEIHPTSHRR